MVGGGEHEQQHESEQQQQQQQHEKQRENDKQQQHKAQDGDSQKRLDEIDAEEPTRREREQRGRRGEAGEGSGWEGGADDLAGKRLEGRASPLGPRLCRFGFSGQTDRLASKRTAAPLPAGMNGACKRGKEVPGEALLARVEQGARPKNRKSDESDEILG